MNATAIAVGNFDGVHRGHRLVLDRLRLLALQRGLEPAVVTFTSHPLQLVAPERAPRLLQTFDQRRAELERAGVRVIALDFTDELRHLSAREFLEMLRDRYGARLLLLGHDNRFGYRPDGDKYSTLHPAAELYGSLCPDLEIVEAPRLEGISSSAVRRAVTAGDMERAAEMLGRPFSYTATVVHGRQLGRTIGFPTANLSVKADLLLPPAGVYFCRATLLPAEPTPPITSITLSSSSFRAMTNIGRRPTVDPADAPLSIETHLLDFPSRDIYGRSLRLEFLHRHRSERRFPDLAALRAQLTADLSALRATQLM